MKSSGGDCSEQHRGLSVQDPARSSGSNLISLPFLPTTRNAPIVVVVVVLLQLRQPLLEGLTSVNPGGCAMLG